MIEVLQLIAIILLDVTYLPVINKHKLRFDLMFVGLIIVYFLIFLFSGLWLMMLNQILLMSFVIYSIIQELRKDDE